jgi:hypothetical protein
MTRSLQGQPGHRATFARRLFVKGLFFALALLGLLPLPALAAQVVTSGGDSGSGSLRQAIADAMPGETITFTAGVTTVTLTSGELGIAKNLTIQGSSVGGVTIQRDVGASDFRIFNISNGAAVTLRGLTIRHGRAPATVSPGVSESYGGGIRSTNSTLTVEDCVISGNQTTGNVQTHGGGGIASLGFNGNAVLTVTRSVIRDNDVGIGQTGGQGAVGGGVLSRVDGFGVSASLTVTDSTFDGNGATSSGGAITNDASNGAVARLAVSGSTISNQRGPDAAVVTFAGSGNNNATASFTNSTISGNPGGGVMVFGQVGAVVSQDLHHVTVHDSTVKTIAAASAHASTSYDRSVFAFTDDDVASSFFVFTNPAGGVTNLNSGGYNVSKKDLPGAVASDLTDTDPLLDPAGLADNGGETDTVALLPDSPARDHIPTAACTEEVDQGGAPRPQPTLGNCDSGALEAQPTPQAADADGDGILDANDLCPNAPEDSDGVQDSDGCPETDSDSDGIADEVDEQPLIASNRFSDIARGGATAGQILSVPAGFTVQIVDHPNLAKGVRVVVTGRSPGQRVRLRLDGKGSTLVLPQGTYPITDPVAETTVEVEQGGPAEVELVIGGRTTIVEIEAGATANITETLAANGTLVDVLVTAVEGVVTVDSLVVLPGESLTVGTLSSIRLIITRVPRQPALRAFVLTATFIPGTGSDGILPLTEVVDLRIGAYAEAIPASSFRRDAQGRFWFTGNLDGVLLAAVITPLQAGRFRVNVAGTGAILAGTVNPVTVGVAIGDDGATAETVVRNLP